MTPCENSLRCLSVLPAEFFSAETPIDRIQPEHEAATAAFVLLGHSAMTYWQYATWSGLEGRPIAHRVPREHLKVQPSPSTDRLPSLQWERSAMGGGTASAQTEGGVPVERRRLQLRHPMFR